MPAEHHMDDDPLIRRVSAARPPIPDAELSSETPQARAMLERILDGTSPWQVHSTPPARSRRRRGAARRRIAPRVGLSLAPVLAALVVVLVLAGAFSGSGGSGPQPALAAVVPAAIRALDPSGAIFVEEQTYLSGQFVHDGRAVSMTQVLETPAGTAAQSLLTLYSDPQAFGSPVNQTGWAYGGGSQEIYSAPQNTIYTASVWGPYLHRGRRPGTYVYRSGPGAPITGVAPVTVSARQAQGLLDGQLSIYADAPGHLTIGVLGDAPSYGQSVRSELKSHELRYVGRRTIRGRAALEVAGVTGGSALGHVHIYLDPRTHLPFEEIDDPGGAHQQVILLRLRKLPITAQNERLLSLHARFPSARVDTDHRDYLRTAGNYQIAPG